MIRSQQPPASPRAAATLLAAVLGLALCWACCWACAPAASTGLAERFDGATMGTTWTATVACPGPLEASDRAALQAALEQALERVNQVCSTYLEDSDLSRFNAAPEGQAVVVDESLLQVLAIARGVHSASSGAFDPTVGPLVDLWGFGPDPAQDRAPSEADRREALALVGLDAVQADPRVATLTKTRAGLELDLSAVAKGFAVDQAARALEQRGHADFLVEVGGELAVRGERPGGGPWRLMIEDPSSGEASLPPARLLLSGAALATSGDYRNWRRLANGSTVAHTLDPRTGFPVAGELASASVVAPTCALADAWATALSVLGEGGLALIEAQPGVEALLQLRQGDSLERRPSSGWSALEPPQGP